jgi:hypothetical protein
MLVTLDRVHASHCNEITCPRTDRDANERAQQWMPAMVSAVERMDPESSCQSAVDWLDECS